MDKDLQFSLTVKMGPDTLAHVKGLSRSPEAITVADLNKVIEVEQYLERMLGLRIHISQL